jgi:hypothetical protein
MNKDHFGYYLVGTHKTYSKIEALELAHSLNVEFTWVFNDDTFSKHPWHIDTKQDIKQLYKKRAEQIRHKYDYIVLWYSGGADSFTMTNTFKENNIHVDEIAQFHAYEGEKSWDSFLNKEVAEVAIPQTKEFLKAMPHTKHRLVDLSPIQKTVFDHDNNKLDFIYKSNNSFGPHQLARTYLREKIDDWKQIIASGKKLCFVWAHDKPAVRYNVNLDKYYLEFHDSIDGGGVGPRIQIENKQEYNDEFFYWSPDAADIITRQAHIVVNYLRNPPKEDLDSAYLTTDPYSYTLSHTGDFVPTELRRASTLINSVVYYLTSEGLHRLIYPNYRLDTFTPGKPYGWIFGPRDWWWFKCYKEKDQSMFIGAMESLYKKFTKVGFARYRTSKQDVDLDFRLLNLDTLRSKKYFLEI